MACMPTSSDTMTPLNPHFERSRSCVSFRERVAGFSLSNFVKTMCDVMIISMPARIAATNGFSSRASSCSGERSKTGSS